VGQFRHTIRPDVSWTGLRRSCMTLAPRGPAGDSRGTRQSTYLEVAVGDADAVEVLDGRGHLPGEGNKGAHSLLRPRLLALNLNGGYHCYSRRTSEIIRHFMRFSDAAPRSIARRGAWLSESRCSDDLIEAAGRLGLGEVSPRPDALEQLAAGRLQRARQPPQTRCRRPGQASAAGPAWQLEIRTRASCTCEDQKNTHENVMRLHTVLDIQWFLPAHLSSQSLVTDQFSSYSVSSNSAGPYQLQDEVHLFRAVVHCKPDGFKSE
jgi:hypothetical protein